MIIKALRLNHFRNYQEEVFHFSDHINVITGSNAQGKTNLLEGLFFLSRGYSHRALTVSDMASFESDHFFIQADLMKETVHHKICITYQNKKKSLTVDDKKEKSHQRVLKIYNTILFEPDDLRIVKAGPEKRRRFMNEEISGMLPGYLPVLKKYRKVLAQRNALLKNIRYSPSMRPLLAGWNEQLVDYGVKLMAYRLDYLKQLNRSAKALHDVLSSNREQLSLYYQDNVIDRFVQMEAMRDAFMEKLQTSETKDIERGTTHFGPHVDDIIVKIDGRDARKYASQGQQRTAAIALKLSQMDIYHELTGDYPVVLLDDILSELDAHRQQNILSILGRSQAFITCTDSHFAGYYEEANKKIIHISDGHQIEI